MDENRRIIELKIRAIDNSEKLKNSKDPHIRAVREALVSKLRAIKMITISQQHYKLILLFHSLRNAPEEHAKKEAEIRSLISQIVKEGEHSYALENVESHINALFSDERIKSKDPFDIGLNVLIHNIIEDYKMNIRLGKLNPESALYNLYKFSAHITYLYGTKFGLDKESASIITNVMKSICHPYSEISEDRISMLNIVFDKIKDKSDMLTLTTVWKILSEGFTTQRNSGNIDKLFDMVRILEQKEGPAFAASMINRVHRFVKATSITLVHDRLESFAVITSGKNTHHASLHIQELLRGQDVDRVIFVIKSLKDIDEIMDNYEMNKSISPETLKIIEKANLDQIIMMCKVFNHIKDTNNQETLKLFRLLLNSDHHSNLLIELISIKDPSNAEEILRKMYQKQSESESSSSPERPHPEFKKARGKTWADLIKEKGIEEVIKHYDTLKSSGINPEDNAVDSYGRTVYITEALQRIKLLDKRPGYSEQIKLTLATLADIEIPKK